MFEGPRWLYQPFHSKDCIVARSVFKIKQQNLQRDLKSFSRRMWFHRFLLCASVQELRWVETQAWSPQVFLTCSLLFSSFVQANWKCTSATHAGVKANWMELSACPWFWKERWMRAFSFSALHFLAANVKDRDWPQHRRPPCTCEMASLSEGLCLHFQCGFLGHSLRSWGRQPYLSLLCLFSAEETRPLTRCSGSPDKDNHVGLLVFRPRWF